MEQTISAERILGIEGADNALRELSELYDINDKNQMSREWPAIEEMLQNFSFKRFSVTPDYLFSEITIKPFRTSAELEKFKSYLLN